MPSYEQKIALLIGGLIGIPLFVFILCSGDILHSAIMISPLTIFFVLLGFLIYKDHRIITKGGCFKGKLVARGREYPFERQRNVKVEFFMDDVRYTVIVPITPLQCDSLTSLECTVHCLEHHGKRRCIVRNFQYNKKFDNVGIVLPEEELLLPQYLAFSDEILS